MASFTQTAKPGGTILYEWTLTTDDPTGVGAQVPGASDKCTQVVASTAGGATIEIEGSNYVSDTFVWTALTDVNDNVASATATDILQIGENPLWIRPRLTTVGAGAVWLVKMLVK